MMNLIQQQDDLRSMPMQRLMQEAQNPSGMYPQYLVVATIKEKTDMQKRAQVQQQAQQQPQATVSEQVIEEGIMSVPPQQPIPTPTGRGILDNPNIPMNMTREEYEAMKAQALLPPGDGYASGGVVRMQQGGMSPFATPVYSPEDYERYQRSRSGIFDPNSLFNITGYDRNKLLRREKERTAGTYDIPGILSEDQYRRMIEETPGTVRVEEGIPDYEFLEKHKGKDLSLAKRLEIIGSLPQEYKKRQRIPTDSAGLTLQDSPQIPEFMQTVSPYGLASSVPVVTEEEALPVGDVADATEEVITEQITVQPTKADSPTGIQVQGDDATRTGITSLEYKDLVEQERAATQDYSDLRQQALDDAFGSAMALLGAGIAKGDLAAGIEAASKEMTAGRKTGRDYDLASLQSKEAAEQRARALELQGRQSIYEQQFKEEEIARQRQELLIKAERNRFNDQYQKESNRIRSETNKINKALGEGRINIDAIVEEGRANRNEITALLSRLQSFESQEIQILNSYLPDDQKEKQLMRITAEALRAERQLNNLLYKNNKGSPPAQGSIGASMGD
jgi:hypothetical protein